MRTRVQTYQERRALWRAAATLKAAAPRGKPRRRVPTVFFVTDPDRTPDPVGVAQDLPRGTGVIFRGFGRADLEKTARALSRVAKRRGLVLLIGGDEALAMSVGANGLHLPERHMATARRVRLRHPTWLITGAAHSPGALTCSKRLKLDAVLLSTVFLSRSPSAGRALGPVKLALLMRTVAQRAHALGGVNGRTAQRLIGTGVAGFAAVDGLL